MAESGEDTLIQALERSAKTVRSLTIAGRDAPDVRLPYSALLERSLCRLSAFHAAGVRAGDAMIILTDDLETFVIAFWACIAGRIIAVPLAAPNTEASALKLLRVAATLDAPWLYTDIDLSERLAATGDGDDEVRGRLGSRTLAAARECEGPAARLAATSGEELAFLQFSSGSTGAPKGVTLTHANVIASVRATSRRLLDTVAEPRLLNWMPLTHDFGMIWFHIMPIVCGFDHYLIPTKAFMRRPLIWMQACADWKASVTAGPNYSFNYVLKHIEPGKDYGWDLSSLRLVVNGAEPIVPELARRFGETLARFGLMRSAMTPGYGLAEATLVVALGDIGQAFRSLTLDRRRLAPGEAAEIVSDAHPNGLGVAIIGRPLDNIEIAIADAAGAGCPEGTVGRVLLRGPAITHGYHNDAAATRAVLDCAGRLDTGDLGFVLDGELVVTGRAKDLVIVGGANFYPQDIETIAAGVPGLDLNMVAACAVPSSELKREALAIFVLFRKGIEAFAPLAEAVGERVGRVLGVPVDYCLPVPRIPKTTSGKIQRFQLSRRFVEGEFAEQAAGLARLSAARDDALHQAWMRRDRRRLVTLLVEVAAGFSAQPVDADSPLLESGFTSLQLTRFAARLNQRLGLDLPVTRLFERPSLRELADTLVAMAPRAATASGIAPSPANDAAKGAAAGAPPVAILGVGLRLPGGIDDPEGLRRLLESQGDAVGPPRPGRWTAAADAAMVTDRAGYLDDIEPFDAAFFRLSAAEAEALDPQQRLLLTTAWEAFERAAIDPDTLKGRRVGVFVGMSGGDYGRTAAASGPYFYTGTSPAVAAGRLAYVFGLTGPCLTIDTACSSSLVALHQATTSVRTGESELALVCGVNLLLTPDAQAGLSRMNALAPDGRCKTFDDAADGYARGEGCVALVIRRLDAALADDDPVRAMIRGSAVNHDGSSNGLTAPNGAAQAAVIAAALADAGLAPDSVGYLEAHGTGTALGDPIEVMAAAQAYGPGRPADRPLLLGTIKTAVGHLEAAAGLAGVVKVLLALEDGRVPASLHFRVPNHRIPWHRLPVAVASAQAWPTTETPRRAAVSSFGMSGTNAHVILEAAPPRAAGRVDAPIVLPLSARTESALSAATERWCAALGTGDGALADLAATAASGRATFAVRKAIVARDADACIAALRRPRPLPRPSRGEPELIFAFAGQGSSGGDAWGALADAIPVFGESLRTAERALRDASGSHLSQKILDLADGGTSSGTEAAQPALVALQLALAATLRDWGIEPVGVIGHSLGEVAAAATAGALTAEAAIRFAAGRGRLMANLPPGAMALVAAAESVVADHIEDGVAIAAFNGPAQLTLSGAPAALARVLERLRHVGIRSTRLPVAHAFHSAQVDALVADLRALADGAGFVRPRLAFHSTLLGRAAKAGKIVDPAYWARQAREPVRFHEALLSLPSGGTAVVVEIGALASLAPLAARVLPDVPWLTCAGSDPHAVLLEVAAQLFERGVDVKWRRVLRGRSGRRIVAPTYPFEGRVPVLPLIAGPTATPATGTHPAPSAIEATSRVDHIRDDLLATLKGLVGHAFDATAGATNWFELGLDSLLLVQLQQVLNRRHGIELKLADILQQGDTPDRLASLIDARRPPDQVETPKTMVPPVEAKPASDGGPLDALFTQQIEAMNALFARQLEVVKGAALPASPGRPAAVVPVPIAPTDIKGLYRQTAARGDETSAQTAHVAELARAYNARTRASKDHTEAYRPVFANPRSIIGFRPEWKELIYPLHVARAEGAHVWDLDGRRYVDVTMGFGATLLGHNPPCVRRAIEAELSSGAPLGPQSPRAGVVARLIADMTGVERVAFFSTGSEAVMVAVRLARAVTGRRRIALFVNSYHGTFDGVLAAGWATPDEITTLPLTDGTPQGMIEDVLVLRYGDPESLARIRQHAGTLAAVLVEPVQSRDPFVPPAAFLAELRTITRENDVALVFDEMITGFRMHPGGTQHLFGIEADIVTYGKVVGGGMPIGVVAGRRRFLDAVDGGAWAYGDGSVPAARTAFVAGTFNGHPLTMAAAEAVLRHLAEAGPALQSRLDARTRALCEDLDGIFARAGVPIKTARFGSLFRFDFAERCEILNYHLLAHGVFVWEGRNCFLSTCHTDEDIAVILAAARAGVEAMRRDGWLGTGPSAMSEVGVGQRPLSHLQREMAFAVAAAPQTNLAYRETVALRLDGRLDEAALSRAVDELVARHEALRAGAVTDAECTVCAPAAGLLRVRAVDDGEAALREALGQISAQPFDLDGGLLFCAELLRCAPDRFVLTLSVHHIVADGWSLGLIAVELADLYRAQLERRPSERSPAIPFAAFAAWIDGLPPGSEASPPPAPRLLLPVDEGATRTAAGARLHRREPHLPSGEPLFAAVKTLARQLSVTPFAILLSAFCVLVGRLADQRRFVVGVPLAGHAAAAMPGLVAHASVVVPLPVDLEAAEPFAAVAARLNDALLALQTQPERHFRPGASSDPVDVLINVDRGFALEFPGLAVDWLMVPIARSKAKLFLNVLEFNGTALFDFDYDETLVHPETAERWFAMFAAIVEAIARSPDLPVDALPPSDESWETEDLCVLGVFDAPVPIGTPGVLERREPSGWRPDGHMARRRVDGGIEILGPVDRFVRTAGEWVDLDRIERCLTALPGLAGTAVALETDRLTVFVTRAVDLGLVALVHRHLPPSLRPVAFAELQTIPRRSDGRIDHAALAASPAPRVVACSSVPPRTADEARIATIWREILRRADVGVTDNFFELGGHSLKALAILARIETAFGRRPALAAFLANPTIAALAALLPGAEREPPVPRCPAAPDHAAAGGQARLWMLQQLQPGLVAYNIAFALATRRDIDEAALGRALARLGARHESLRTALVDVDGEPRQRISAQAIVDLVAIEMRTTPRAEEAASRVAEDFAATPFDLVAAPLWRVRLLRLPQGCWIVLSIHHAICDVWSIEVFIREILQLLDEEQGGPARPLPDLPFTFKDYVVSRRDRAPDRSDSLALWRERLADRPPPLDLPSDRARPAVKTHNGGVATAVIPQDVAAALRIRASAAEASLFTVMGAGLHVLLYRLTGHADMVIGTVTAGRDRGDLAHQIGFFVDTLPLRLGLAGTDRFDDVVRGFRNRLGEAIRLALPFEEIVQGVGVAHDASRNPLFDVVLVMDERSDIRHLLAEHDFDLVEIDTATSQFDLTLYVTENVDTIGLKAIYNCDLFDVEPIDAMLAQWIDILTIAGRCPELPVERLAAGRRTVTPSFLQERLWFVDSFERGTLYADGPVYYNMPLVLACEERLDLDGLRQALGRLAARHELLRAAFRSDGEAVTLVVEPSVSVPLISLDPVGTDPLEPILAENARPFDIAAAPLFRVTVQNAAAGPALLCLTAHHAIADRSALAALAGELFRLYHDPDAILPALESFGAAVAAPERAAQGMHAADAAFWRARLDGSRPLALPTDRGRAAIHTYRSGRIAATLDAERVVRLDTLASTQRAERVDILRAAFQAFLFRVSGQTDIVIGETTSSPGARSVGPGSNLVVERLELSASETFAGVLERSRHMRDEALAHGAMPFDLVVLAVEPKNDMSRTALFDVLFHADAEAVPAGTRVIETGLGFGKYDLVLACHDRGEAIDASLVFNRDLFEEASAARLAQRFLRLLDGVVADPERPIADIDLMLDGEADALLARAHTEPFDSADTLHGLFERVAAERPDAEAVSDENGALSYGALNAAANRLAHRLLALGVTSEDLVGIYLGRRAALVVAMLGILKAGAAYVPIDPDYPHARARFMAEDCGLRVVVTDMANRAEAEALAPVAVDVHDIDIDIAASEANPTLAVPPRNLAYVIYTSGSTGTPKGVTIEHRNVVHLFLRDRDRFAFGPSDVWTLFHSPCFDFSVWEIYGALLFGGRLVVVPQMVTRDPPAFLALLSTQGVSVLNQTPTAFHALADAACAQPESALAVRLVIFGGEALQPGRLARWHAAHPHVRLVNMYGITETTVHVTAKDIGDAEIADGRSLIGHPLQGYGIVLLDPARRLTPLGLAGEICIAGQGVARGYLDRPELTGERFVTPPDVSTERLYRSGDLGRFGADGQLVYLGRLDDQVKVRGFRVETSEIEAQLLAHPLVSAAVVLPDGDDGLAAWLVCDPTLTRDAIHAHLGDKLPGFMIPSRLSRIAAVPTTTHGKIDRRRLVAMPAEPLAAPGATDDAPRPGIEAAVMAIWQELLPDRPIRRTDNFFELGGHSLKATQAVSRIRRRLDRPLTLKDFFSAPTLAALAETLGRMRPSGIEAIAAAPLSADYPLSFAQRRLWALQARRPQQVDYNMVGGFLLEGDLDVDALARALAALVGRHEILRTRFVLRRGEPRQVVDPAPAAFALPVEDGGDADATSARVLEAELRHVFALDEGPLLRVRLHRLATIADASHWLLAFNLHHIVADGWSVNVMLRDLERLYRAARGDAHAAPAALATRLPPLAIQYKDFAIGQRTLAAGPGSAQSRDYWRERFEDGGPVLDLPLDRPRPSVPSGAGAIAAATLDAALSDRLRALALAHEASLFVVLAALVHLQMHLMSGARDIVVGTPVAGRQHVDLESQAGLYLNLLPLRIDHSDLSSFEALLATARTIVHDALQHQAYPFDLLVEDVIGEPAEGRQPLFDVLVILQNNEPLRLALPDVSARPLRDTTVSAKYDLNYMFEDRPALELMLEYAVDLFEPASAAKIAADFVALASLVVEAPGLAAGELAERLGYATRVPGVAAGAALLAEGW